MILIAELGVNHEGSLAMAHDMLYAARAAGIKVAKMQLYDPFTFLNESHPLWSKRTGLKDVMESWKDLIDYSKSIGLMLGFSVFSRDYWIAHKYADFIKIAARQLDNIPELLTYIQFLNEVSKEKTIFCSYRLDQKIENLRPLFLGSKHYFLVVNSEYPTTLEKAQYIIDEASKTKDQDWGFSCHTPNDSIIYYAAQKGANICEVHFTLDHNQSDFRDHKVGFDYEELTDLINGLNNFEKVLH